MKLRVSCVLTHNEGRPAYEDHHLSAEGVYKVAANDAAEEGAERHQGADPRLLFLCDHERDGGGVEGEVDTVEGGVEVIKGGVEDIEGGAQSFKSGIRGRIDGFKSRGSVGSSEPNCH